MRLLYPDDPLNQRMPEGLFAREFDVARTRGFDASIFSFEDFERGRFNPKPRPVPGEAVIYRGWMLNLDGYARLAQAITQLSAQMAISLDSYRAAHHLPSWYPLVKDFTAETLVFEENTDFVNALRGMNWPGYFVKDYVKSLSTGAGSLVQTPEEIARVASQLKKYRGEIEGGVCVRRREDYVPGSERRYFVAGGRACSFAGDVPAAVTACAPLIPSPFFSVDTALRTDGALRIIELGDGQVSDRKEWSAEKLVEVLEHVG
jgi:hypothetical protein